MKIGVLGNLDGWHVLDLERACLQLGLPLTKLDFRKLNFSLLSQFSDSMMEPDVLLVRTMPPGSLEQVVFRMDVLHALMRKGKKVVNPPRALEAAVDKFLASELLSHAGLQIPPTICCQDSDSALEAFEQLGRNIILKPLFGAEGRGMFLIDQPDLAYRAFRTVERLGGILYLQKFIQHPGWDMRVWVLGDKVLGCMKRHAPRGEWKTNVAQGGKAELVAGDDEIMRLGVEATRAVGAQMAGVDLLLDETGTWNVIEVNAVPGWRAFAKVSGIDVAKAILEYVIRN